MKETFFCMSARQWLDYHYNVYCITIAMLVTIPL